MPEQVGAIWWIELIRVSPGLIVAVLAVALVLAYRKDLNQLIKRITRFKALGFEAEFAAKELEKAIETQGVPVTPAEKHGVLKRLQLIAPLLKSVRILWVDDHPQNNVNERALVEDYGISVKVASNSADAEKELRESSYLMVITDLERAGNAREGLEFVDRTIRDRTYRPTIAYTGADQEGKPRPAHLFGITNRPDHLIHYVCDIVERERL